MAVICCRRFRAAFRSSSSTILRVRHSRPNPLAFRVRPRHALTSRRILHEPLPIPDQHPGIEQFIVENTGAARDAAADAGVTPGAAERAGNAFPVQFDRNRYRASTGGEVTEDSPDDGGFVGNDCAVATAGLAT